MEAVLQGDPSAPGNKGGVRTARLVEETPFIIDGDACQAGILYVGPHEVAEADHEQFQAPPLGGGGAKTKKPSRGLMQKLKGGAGQALATMRMLTLMATCEMNWAA